MVLFIKSGSALPFTLIYLSPLTPGEKAAAAEKTKGHQQEILILSSFFTLSHVDRSSNNGDVAENLNFGHKTNSDVLNC